MQNDTKASDFLPPTLFLSKAVLSFLVMATSVPREIHS